MKTLVIIALLLITLYSPVELTRVIIMDWDYWTAVHGQQGVELGIIWGSVILLGLLLTKVIRHPESR